MNGYRCLCCGHIFPLADAMAEFVSFRDGGPATRYSCPDCLSHKVTEVFVCPECQREELVSGEDLGKNCLQHEQDALDELQLDRFDVRHANVVPFRRVG